MPASRHSANFNATVVAGISGEMGNQIGYMSRGLLLKWALFDDHGVRSQLWLRHQSHRKWIGARASMQKCFASTRTMDFERGNTEEFDAKKATQESRYGRAAYAYAGAFEHNNLTAFVERIEAAGLPSDGNASSAIEVGTDTTMSLPFIHSTGLQPPLAWDTPQLQRYYAKIRRFFAFDFNSTQCCNPAAKPDPDESVFHFRNFKTELRRPSIRINFPELGPRQAARDLFGHLPRGSKVAIISRFLDDNVQRHVTAFEDRGLRVRVISGNSGEQDFCFLLSAEKEIAGAAKSTYFYWAGLLGRAETVRLYTVDLTVADQYRSFGRFNVSNLVTNSTLDADWHLS